MATNFVTQMARKCQNDVVLTFLELFCTQNDVVFSIFGAFEPQNLWPPIITDLLNLLQCFDANP